MIRSIAIYVDHKGGDAYIQQGVRIRKYQWKKGNRRFARLWLLQEGLLINKGWRVASESMAHRTVELS